MTRELTYDQAREQTRPRPCAVPQHRRGGAACCELCRKQGIGRSENRTILLCAEHNMEVPLFVRREGEA